MNAPEPLELYQSIPVGALAPSPTNPRKRFDEGQLSELADSLRNEGLLVPLLVRPHKSREGSYELVAGERRLRAAKKAGLASLRCIVRDLTDQQVELHQAIEHVQRAEIHPLEEAEEYEGLAKRHGLSVEDIAARVSKSASYVRGRMKLAALSPKAREWFYKGSLTPATALLVARIPVPSLQDEAVEKLVLRHGGAMSPSEAAGIVRDHYMMRLDRASFDPADSSLIPAAGPCGTCPKRTGNQAEMFGDVKDPQTCTDPQCYDAKRKKAAEIKRAKAEAEGRTVISGKAAEKAWPAGYESPVHDQFVRLSDRCYDDMKGRTFKELLGKEGPAPVLLENARTGELVEVIETKAARAVLREKGIGSTAGKGLKTPDEKAREAKAKQEAAARRAVFDAIRAQPLTLGQADLALIARRFFADIWNEYRKQVAKLWDFDPKKADPAIEALSVEQLGRLLLDMALVGDLHVQSYSLANKPKALEEVAARVGVDAAKIRAEFMAELRAKEKAKKALKPKMAAKAKKAGATAEASSGSPGRGKGKAKAKAKATAQQEGIGESGGE